MLKVRPTSLSFVLVWNTPAAYGTHILKSIAKILKEYNGQLQLQICKQESATNGNRVQSLISCAQLLERRLALKPRVKF